MVLYSLHVFDRSGRCLFDREWNGERDDGGEHQRLVFGMLRLFGVEQARAAGRAPDGHITVRTDTTRARLRGAGTGRALMSGVQGRQRGGALPRLRPALGRVRRQVAGAGPDGGRPRRLAALPREGNGGHVRRPGSTGGRRGMMHRDKNPVAWKETRGRITPQPTAA